jgi:MFS family permease
MQPAPQGAAPHTAAPHGAAPQGATPQGATPHGATPHGAAPQGATPHAAVPHALAPDSAAPQGDAAMRRQVWLLFFCLALMHSSIVGQAMMAALIGHSLAENKALATLPIAIQMTATMAASIPAGIVFARLGRRPGFLLGAGFALLGSAVFALGVWRGDFLLYCLGAVPAGLGFGIGQHYRFAAAEVATPAYRPKAISLVMTGGVLSAAIGPEIVKHTSDLLVPYLFLGTYLVLLVLPVLCMLLLCFARLPPPPARRGGGASIGTIIARPTFMAAVLIGAVAFGTMNLVMTSTPVEMMFCGFGIGASATVIQAHVLAMYAPGFVTGGLIARFGVRPVIAAGTVLSALCVAVGLQGESFWHFVVALTLLGIGWNFMFVGATTLLGTAHSAEERMRAQAANDLIVFGTVACTAFLSGAVHAGGGWDVLNLSILPPLALAGAMLLWHRARAPAARPA